MLILTRRIGEGVLIGDGIRVVVLEVRGKQFRLGIDAPNDVVVLRDEIFQRLTHENLQATTFLLDDLQVLKRAVNGRIPAGCHPFAGAPQGACLALESKFGPLQVPEDQIITFNQGLLGFPSFQRFFLLSRPEITPFFILQCVDHAEFAVVLTEPVPLEPGFRLNRLNSIMGDLKVQGPEELSAFVTLTIPSDQPTAATANLVSPILINPKLRLGKQIVLENAQYSHKHRLLPD